MTLLTPVRDQGSPKRQSPEWSSTPTPDRGAVARLLANVRPSDLRTSSDGSLMERLCKLFLASASAGDTEAVVGAAHSLINDGIPLKDLVHRFIVPALVESGRRWHANEWTAAECQVAAAAAQAIVSLTERVNTHFGERGHLVVACVEGELHDLPARIVAGEIRRSGWKVSYLGASIPATDLRTFALQQKPDAVLLSCTSPASLRGVPRSVDAVHQAGIRVIVGGAAFGADPLRAQRSGADGWATTAEGAIRILRGLDASHDVPAHPAVSRTSLAREAELERHQRQVAHDAGAVARRDRAWRSEPAPDRLEPLCGALMGSVLFSDDRIFEGHVQWLGQYLSARGGSASELYSDLFAVQSALPDHLVHARRLVNTALDRVAGAGERAAKVEVRVAAASRAASLTASRPASQAASAEASLEVVRSSSSNTNEAARCATLAAFDIIDTAPEAIFDELVSLAVKVCDTPVGWLSFIDSDREWFKSCVGTDLDHLPREIALSSHTIEQTDLVAIPDLSAHVRYSRHPLVAGGDRWRFYAAIPLLAGCRQVIGALAVVDYRPRLLTTDQQRGLRTLGHQVMAQLRLRRQTRGEDGAAAPDAVAQARLQLIRGSGGGDSTKPDERAVFSTREVAGLLNVSARAVTNWAAKGRLKSLQTAGGHYRFTEQAVVEFLTMPPPPRG